MRSSSVLICAVPASCWGATASGDDELLGRLLADLRVQERRLGKGVNSEEEAIRYAETCALIEGYVLARAEPCGTQAAFLAAIKAGRFPCVRVGPAYLELLQRLREADETFGFRVGASVIPPETVRSHVVEFRRVARLARAARVPAIADRLRFLNASVASHGYGVVEVQVPLSDPFVPAIPKLAGRIGWWARLLQSLGWASGNSMPPSAREDWSQYGTRVEDRGDYMSERLRNQIRASLAGRGAVAQQSHKLMTIGLREFVVRTRGVKPGTVRLQYGDGSEGQPFPLGQVRASSQKWVPTRELRAALMSMRHLPLDKHIDLNWFTNTEVQGQRTSAQAEEFCFEAARVRFAELRELYRGERLLLHLYHTGLEPAVIGFYRALVVSLIEAGGGNRFGRNEWIKVVPYFNPERDSDSFERGQRWPS